MRIFETVLRMSASASVAIAVVLLLRLVLKRMPKGFTWVLWLAVLARLCCPVFPTVQLGVSVPTVEPAAVIGQMLQEPAAPTTNLPQEQTPAQTTTPTEPAADPVNLLGAAWAVGAVSMAVWGAASDLSLRKRLRTAVRREDGVYLADGIDTPFVRGLLLPRIYLPSDLDGAGERYILLHERCHIRCLDPLAKLLFFGALCIHWFNPLVWLACALAERDMELRCDEGVFRNLEQDERMDYASALVACAARRRELLPLAFGEGDTKRRVKNMLTYKKPKWWAIVLAGILCITAVGCMLVDPEPAYDPEKLEYPGLNWGVSPESVLDVLGKTEADIIHEIEDRNDDLKSDYWRYTMILHGVEAFGQETTAAAFIFSDYTQTGEDYRLEELRLFYPDGYDGAEKADMTALNAELERFYGAVSKAEHWDEAARKHLEVTQEHPANVFGWDSALTCWDLMTQEQRDGVYAYYCDKSEDPVSMEEFAQDWQGRAFHISLQPYHHRYMAQMGRAIDEDARSWGVTNVCITMDALAHFGVQHTAEVWMKSE